MSIEFDLQHDGNNSVYVTRLNDREVKFSYDDFRWTLESIEFEYNYECFYDHRCEKHDCDLDELIEKRLYVEDEYCAECPRIKKEFESSSSLTSNAFSHPPFSLEDARQQVMKGYVSLSHNGLQDHDFKTIMMGPWESKELTI